MGKIERCMSARWEPCPGIPLAARRAGRMEGLGLCCEKFALGDPTFAVTGTCPEAMDRAAGRQRAFRLAKCRGLSPVRCRHGDPFDPGGGSAHG